MIAAAGRGRPLLELVLCGMVFAGAPILASDSMWAGIPIGFVFWWGLQWGSAPGWRGIARSFANAVGLALVVEALVSYTNAKTMSNGAFLGACAAAGALIITVREISKERPAQAILFVGCTPAYAGMADSLQLNAVEALETEVAERKPAHIVLPAVGWERHSSPRFLLECKAAGTRVDTDATLEERCFERVPLRCWRAADLLWSESLRQARPLMAVQAVYSNLTGLALLVLLGPLLLVAGFAARMSAGQGPLFERVECAGFQGVPYFKRGFRVRRANEEITGIGRLLTRLRLRGLPQLINLVRGEMGLFGPQTVRVEFARYLEGASVVFARRLSVKPGIFGWAQAHGGPRQSGPVALEIQEETMRLTYDLYYLEYGSPLMDMEILVRTLLRPFWRPRGR